MANRSFATNNLVRDHDIYINFMKDRAEVIKKEGIDEPKIIFYKKGKSASLIKNTTIKERAVAYKAISKWHCIRTAYRLWCLTVYRYGQVIDNVAVPYKRSVHLEADALSEFKNAFEKAIKESGVDYNKRNSHAHENKYAYNACRYLAMYWTYLDIIKDTWIQRYFPDKQTRDTAMEVFGCKRNPFEMNGSYWHHNSEEETKMEEVNGDILEKRLEDLDFSVRTENCLYRAGVRKFGSLLMLTVNDILHIRNLGINSFREVVSKLQEYGYTYPEDKSNPRIPYVKDTLPVKEQNEESVIDIAEQAAKEVEEERAMPEPPLRDLRETFNKLKDDYDKLDAKHDELLKTAQEQADRYDELLKQKLDLEAYNSRLRDDISNLKDRVSELVAANQKINITSNPKNFDTFALLNIVLEKMRDSKMEYILVTVDGMVIDIHPKQNIPIRPTAYQIRTSEAR